MEDTAKNSRSVLVFNRCCAAGSLVFLLISAVVIAYYEPTYNDFPQYHIAGAVGVEGRWDVLYPVPIAGSEYNAGTFFAAREKPAALAIAKAHGIYVGCYFMQPPPTALLFIPLGLFGPASAFLLWSILSAIGVWLTGWYSGRLFERCKGRPSCWAGVIMLVLAFAPLTQWSIEAGNCSTMVAAMLAWATLELMSDDSQFSRRSAIGTAVAIVVATMLKYAGVILLPIAIRQGRWGIVRWCILLAAGWTALAWLIMGDAPFHDFFFSIAPTLGRTHELPDNLCLSGFILHIQRHRLPLAWPFIWSIRIMQLVTLILLLFLLRRQGQAMHPATVAAAATAMIAWMLLFNPITWPHYLLYTCAMWGWLIHAGSRSWVHAAIVGIVIGIYVLPAHINPPPSLDPWNLRYTGSLLAILLLAVDALMRTSNAGRLASPRAGRVSERPFSTIPHRTERAAGKSSGCDNSQWP